MTRVTRDAYVDAFRRVTGRPLVQLPQMAGQSESEIFFEALARNDAAPTVPAAAAPTDDGSDELLARFVSELATALRRPMQALRPETPRAMAARPRSSSTSTSS